MKKWDKALTAYKSVDRSAFTGAASWRIELLKEYQAYCTYKAGRVKDAKKMLTHLLDRYESAPELILGAGSLFLYQLAGKVSSDQVERIKRIEIIALKPCSLRVVKKHKKIESDFE